MSSNLESMLSSPLRELLASHDEANHEYLLHALADYAEATGAIEAPAPGPAGQRALTLLSCSDEQLRLAFVCSIGKNRGEGSLDRLGIKEALLSRLQVEPNRLVRLAILSLLSPTISTEVSAVPALPTDSPAFRLVLQASRVRAGDLSPECLHGLLQNYISYANSDEAWLSVENHFYEALCHFPLTSQQTALEECLKGLRRSEDLLEAARHLLCLVFDDSRTGWEDRLVTPSSRWKVFGLDIRGGSDHESVEYWNLSGVAPAMPAEWNFIQVKAVSALLASKRLWRLNTNLWQLFGFAEGRASLRKCLAKAHQTI